MVGKILNLNKYLSSYCLNFKKKKKSLFLSKAQFESTLRFAAFKFPTFSFFFFFASPFPNKRLLFMYCTWTVATTFDQSSVNSASVHCLRTHKFHFLSIFSLKMGLTTLFTHLKIILLQYFQFSVFSFSKISSI